MVEADAGAGLENIHLSDRDMASRILDRIDYEQQLTAITGLLARNKAVDQQLETERKEIIEFIKKSSGSAQERAIDESDENFYAMVYQGAAHSMAALGMIAPMYESMFLQAFQGIREAFRDAGVSLPTPIAVTPWSGSCEKMLSRRQGTAGMGSQTDEPTAIEEDDGCRPKAMPQRDEKED